MTATVLAPPTIAETYQSDFEALQASDRLADLAPIASVRAKALERFTELGFPTTRHEDWRRTNLATIAKTPFRLASTHQPDIAEADLAPFLLEGDITARLVFVNGVYSAALSSTADLPAGVDVRPLSQAASAHVNLIERHYARAASFENRALTALNTAFVEDVALVHVKPGIEISAPIHLLFLTVSNSTPLIAHPRSLIVIEEAARATIIETAAGLGSDLTLTNAVTEAFAGQGASLEHARLVQGADAERNISTLALRQERDSYASSTSHTLSGAMTRSDIHAMLDGEHCECVLSGLSMLTGARHVDNHLRVEHAKPHGDSRELYKSVLDDQSRSVFSGRIVVHQDAQKTDAKQTSANLLLSNEAHADAKPQLEIFADDVKCTHAATIGQLDNEALFYLQARGISKAAANKMLIRAFAAEIISMAPTPSLRRQLERALFQEQQESSPALEPA